MNKNALIPRRKVLGLGVALAGLCAGCAVLPDAGSAESAARSGAASASASTGAEEKAPRTELNSVHLRDNPELYTVYDDSGVVTMYLTVSRGNDSENTNHSWAQINNILKYNTFPLAEIISDILTMGAEEMRCPVEVEFAVNMDVAPGQRQVFNLLQIRPIIDNQDNRPIDWSKVDVSDALVYGQNALGIGMMGDIADIIYIKSNTFDSLSTEKIAEELLEFNNRMQDEKQIGRAHV